MGTRFQRIATALGLLALVAFLVLYYQASQVGRYQPQPGVSNMYFDTATGQVRYVRLVSETKDGHTIEVLADPQNPKTTRR